VLSLLYGLLVKLEREDDDSFASAVYDGVDADVRDDGASIAITSKAIPDAVTDASDVNVSVIDADEDVREDGIITPDVYRIDVPEASVILRKSQHGSVENLEKLILNIVPVGLDTVI
jgi:hypothetical protein